MAYKYHVVAAVDSIMTYKYHVAAVDSIVTYKYSSSFLSVSFFLSVNQNDCEIRIKHITILKKCPCLVEPTTGPFHNPSCLRVKPHVIGDLNTMRYRTWFICNHLYLFTTERKFYKVKPSGRF
jgi:hypothetical protein